MQEQNELYIRVERGGREVHWFRGSWEDRRKRVFVAVAERDKDTLETTWFDDVWRYELADNETVWEEDLYPEDLR